MQFGFITHVVGNPARDGSVMDSAVSGRLLREAIELAVLAEESGFDSFWVAQHHFGAQNGHCPSPLLLLAAIAQHTDRIRLGTAVLIGSIEHPTALAENAAMVDALSGGRLELGLGAGADESTAVRFGRDHSRRHEAFQETLDHLFHAFSDAGDIVPHAPGLRERMWIGTASEFGFQLAAEHNLGVLTGRSSSADGPRDEVAASRARDYAASQRRQGRTPRVGMSRSVLCAADRQSAFEHLRPGIEAWVDRAKSTGRFPQEYLAADYVEAGHSYLGAGQAVREALENDLVTPHASDILCNVQPAAPGAAAVRESLRVFGAEVIAPWRG